MKSGENARRRDGEYSDSSDGEGQTGRRRRIEFMRIGAGEAGGLDTPETHIPALMHRLIADNKTHAYTQTSTYT